MPVWGPVPSNWGELSGTFSVGDVVGEVTRVVVGSPLHAGMPWSAGASTILRPGTSTRLTVAVSRLVWAKTSEAKRRRTANAYQPEVESQQE